MKNKRSAGKGPSAAGWFYGQSGFHQFQPEPTQTPVCDNWFRNYQPADEEEKCYECEMIVWAPNFEAHQAAHAAVKGGRG